MLLQPLIKDSKDGRKPMVYLPCEIFKWIRVFREGMLCS